MFKNALATLPYNRSEWGLGNTIIAI